MITRDEIIEEAKTATTSFNKQNANCERKNSYVLLPLSITITLLIAVSIYSYLIKSIQKHLLPYYITNDKLKKSRMCCYFDDMMRVGDFDFDNILLNEKSYENSFENSSIYVISYKTFMGAKPLCITFNKINGFIKIDDGTRCLALFGPKRYDAIYDRIRYLISEKSGIT